MMKKYLTLFLLFSICQFGQHLSKVYVLSEGGFSPGTAMLSMINNNVFSQNIFAPGNIGLYADGLSIHEDHLYLTEQGGFGGPGKIYKLDTLGNVLASAVVGTNPYSLTTANNKIYITNGPASNVSVLNISDLSLIQEIPVGAYPQEIISFDNKVFVANTSLFGGSEDSTVSVIDAENDNVINTIVVNKDPSSLALSNDNHLLIGCPGDGVTGIIYKVELVNFTKVDSFVIPVFGFGKDISVDKNSDMIYFISGSNTIAELDLSSGIASAAVNDPTVLFTYGYGYDYVNQIHYVADAKTFMSNGSINVYSNTGNKLAAHETGIAPRRIVLNYNTSSTSVNDSKIKMNFALEQNYPNPFNPTTRIKFVIPAVETGHAPALQTEIRVFDLLGSEVATLMNKPLSAGSYEIEFDGSNLPSGVYYYKLTAGIYSETKKMMLVK